MKSFRLTALCSTAFLFAACASTPMGPTVRAMPQQGKPFEVFQAEQAGCKQYADDQVRGQADRANTTGLLEGVGGTILGAGLGAAIGGGHGAAIGAAGGAVAGTAVGANTSSHDQRGIQQQYNDAYVQCMVAKGNQVQRPVVYAPPTTTIIYTQPAPPPPPTVIYTTAPPPPVAYPAVPPPPYYEGR
ncbi:MAG: glycine zipper family protein [Alphaproteobacteria bacterium]